MTSPERGHVVANALAGFLLGVSLFVGLVALTVLGLSIVFGASGFGGDATTTAASRAGESRGQFAGVVAVTLAAAAIPLFIRLRQRPNVRALALVGVVLAEADGVAVLLSAAG